MSVIWKDGHFLDADTPSVSHRDSGFTNGLGVFDVMMGADGAARDMDLHLARLTWDARLVLGMEVDVSPVAAAIPVLLSRNGLKDGYARLRSVITGGIGDMPLGIGVPSLMLSAVRCDAPQMLPPLVCTIVRDYPRIAGCVLENTKRLDYSRAVAARRMAQILGAEDAIVTNTTGNIACGTTGNVFIEENGILMTPPLDDGVIAGVTRHKLIAEGAKEEKISVERLLSAQRVFISNSVQGLRAVQVFVDGLYSSCPQEAGKTKD